MSLDELMASLALEVEREREKIITEAHAATARIVNQAKREADERRTGPKEEAVRRVEAEKARRLHAAGLEEGDLVREAMAEALAELVAEAGRRLDALTGTAYRPVLRRLLAEAVSDFESGEVFVPPGDREMAAALLAEYRGDFRLKADPGMARGLRFVSADGLITVDNTWPTRLQRYIEQHEDEVFAVLLPERRHA